MLIIPAAGGGLFTRLVFPVGQTVMAGKGTCSMGIWATEVTTGFFFQAEKLLLMTYAERAMPEGK